MDNKKITENLKQPISKEKLILKYCTNKIVLDIGCVNHNILNTKNSNWLHGIIKNVAKELVGIDYLKKEVDMLVDNGYNVICADVCKPFSLNKIFDVIVISNLIEHVSNFETLLINVKNHLDANGVVLISTPNPFFVEQYFYSAFKNDIIVNNEHTCWIDPVTLEQLVTRFDLRTEKVYWLKKKWGLHCVIMNGSRYQFDIMTGHWTFCKEKKLFEDIIIRIVKPILILFFHKKYIRFKEAYNYANNSDRLIYIKVMSILFSVFWMIYKIIIPTSKINKYGLFFSVIKLKK